jgi:hypothetical protein
VEIADSQQGNELQSTVPNSKRRLTLPSQRLLLLDMTRSNLNPARAHTHPCLWQERTVLRGDPLLAGVVSNQHAGVDRLRLLATMLCNQPQ